MIVVIFELIPKPNQQARYFSMAADLKPLVEQIDGFIGIERFVSIADPNKFLSLSFWQDETAVKNWREQMEHQQAQQCGKQSIFADYRLRVAHVVRDYSCRL